jgi:hypothetical protein
MDYLSGGYQIYAQRVDSSGAPQWTADGFPICTATGIKDFPQITGDGAGGAIITWQDERSGTKDIYAQKTLTTSTPCGWDNGKKSGWNDSMPPGLERLDKTPFGFDKGNKAGWDSNLN